MTSTNDLGLSNDRVLLIPGIELNDVECSSICEGILWKPVSCGICETHYCSVCIQKWLSRHPNQCPMRCQRYDQRPCSKFIARQLAKLQIKCIYQPNGCNEIVPYDALETHEKNCEFQMIQCFNCSQSILRKSQIAHQVKCSSTRFHRERTSYNEETNNFERNTITLSNFQGNMSDVSEHITRTLISNGLIVDTTPNRIERTHLPSTTDLNSLQKDRVIAERQSIQEILCSVCNEVVWKPVSCKQCQTIFCYKCSPWVGVVGRFVTFFTGKKSHGTKNCTEFTETTLPDVNHRTLVSTKFQCCYAPNGCRQECYYNDLTAHEQVCKFEAVPCSICNYPISKRPSTTTHTKRECFEFMHMNNPSPLQQQLLFLFEQIEATKQENSSLQSTVNTLNTRLKILEEQIEKKNNTSPSIQSNTSTNS